jgi:uncharacterized protein YkwD
MTRASLLFLVPFASAFVACSSPDPGSLLSSQRVQLGPNGAVEQTPGSGASGATADSTDGGPSSSTSGGTTTPAADAGTSTTDALQHCVDVINSYRAQISVPAYARSSSLEAFAATGAQSDSQTGEAHGHFVSTNGGNGIAYAENEVPGWPLDQYGSITDVIDQGMQMMWAEGPGGGHYDNMASTDYTQAGCGTYVTSDGDVWITTDFR